MFCALLCNETFCFLRELFDCLIIPGALCYAMPCCNVVQRFAGMMFYYALMDCASFCCAVLLAILRPIIKETAVENDEQRGICQELRELQDGISQSTIN